jgi:uncharacterized DUF497 family protein
MEFRWNEWNIEHVQEHGVSPEEAEDVVRDAQPPYPEARGDDKWRVCGPGRGGRMVQVVFVTDEDGTTYIIHARPLTDREKHRYRRRQR